MDIKLYDKVLLGSMWSNENFCIMGVVFIYVILCEGYVVKEVYLMEVFSVGVICCDNDYLLLVGIVFIGFGIFLDYWK